MAMDDTFGGNRGLYAYVDKKTGKYRWMTQEEADNESAFLSAEDNYLKQFDMGLERQAKTPQEEDKYFRRIRATGREQEISRRAQDLYHRSAMMTPATVYRTPDGDVAIPNEDIPAYLKEMRAKGVEPEQVQGYRAKGFVDYDGNKHDTTRDFFGTKSDEKLNKILAFQNEKKLGGYLTPKMMNYFGFDTEDSFNKEERRNQNRLEDEADKRKQTAKLKGRMGIRETYGNKVMGGQSLTEANAGKSGLQQAHNFFNYNLNFVGSLMDEGGEAVEMELAGDKGLEELYRRQAAGEELLTWDERAALGLWGANKENDSFMQDPEALHELLRERLLNREKAKYEEAERGTTFMADVARGTTDSARLMGEMAVINTAVPGGGATSKVGKIAHGVGGALVSGALHGDSRRRKLMADQVRYDPSTGGLTVTGKGAGMLEATLKGYGSGMLEYLGEQYSNELVWKPLGKGAKWVVGTSVGKRLTPTKMVDFTKKIGNKYVNSAMGQYIDNVIANPTMDVLEKLRKKTGVDISVKGIINESIGEELPVNAISGLFNLEGVNDNGRVFHWSEAWDASIETLKSAPAMAISVGLMGAGTGAATRTAQGMYNFATDRKTMEESLIALGVKPEELKGKSKSELNDRFYEEMRGHKGWFMDEREVDSWDETKLDKWLNDHGFYPSFDNGKGIPIEQKREAAKNGIRELGGNLFAAKAANAITRAAARQVLDGLDHGNIVQRLDADIFSSNPHAFSAVERETMRKVMALRSLSQSYQNKYNMMGSMYGLFANTLENGLSQAAQTALADYEGQYTRGATPFPGTAGAETVQYEQSSFSHPVSSSQWNNNPKGGYTDFGTGISIRPFNDGEGNRAGYRVDVDGMQVQTQPTEIDRELERLGLRPNIGLPYGIKNSQFKTLDEARRFADNLSAWQNTEKKRLLSKAKTAELFYQRIRGQNANGLVLLQRPEDAPMSIRDEVVDATIAGGLQNVFTRFKSHKGFTSAQDGKVYVFLNNVQSPYDLMQTIHHEGLHQGLLDTFMGDKQKLESALMELSYIEDLPGWMRSALRESGNNPRHFEELLAQVAETVNAGPTLFNKVSKALRRATARVNGLEMSEGDVNALIFDAYKATRIDILDSNYKPSGSYAKMMMERPKEVAPEAPTEETTTVAAPTGETAPVTEATPTEAQPVEPMPEPTLAPTPAPTTETQSKPKKSGRAGNIAKASDVFGEEEDGEGEVTPTEPTETEDTTPTETTPTATTPTETATAETAPVETTPTEATPVETTPVEATPTEEKPTEEQPEEVKPTEENGEQKAEDDNARNGDNLFKVFSRQNLGDGSRGDGKTYVEKHGTILSPDTIRTYLPGYKANDYKTHIDKSGFVGEIFNEAFEHLLKTKDSRNSNDVVFLAGGNGVGKSTASSNLTEDANFVIDTTFGNLEGSRKLLQRVIDNGLTPHIVFVYRDPIETLDFLAKRVNNGGHSVSPVAFANSHTKPRQNVEYLKNEFGDAVTLTVLYNKLDNEPRMVTLAELPKQEEGDYERIRKRAAEVFGGQKPQDSGKGDGGSEQGSTRTPRVVEDARDQEKVNNKITYESSLDELGKSIDELNSLTAHGVGPSDKPTEHSKSLEANILRLRNRIEHGRVRFTKEDGLRAPTDGDVNAVRERLHEIKQFSNWELGVSVSASESSIPGGVRKNKYTVDYKSGENDNVTIHLPDGYTSESVVKALNKLANRKYIKATKQNLEVSKDGKIVTIKNYNPEAFNVFQLAKWLANEPDTQVSLKTSLPNGKNFEYYIARDNAMYGEAKQAEVEPTEQKPTKVKSDTDAKAENPKPVEQSTGQEQRDNNYDVSQSVLDYVAKQTSEENPMLSWNDASMTPFAENGYKKIGQHAIRLWVENREDGPALLYTVHKAKHPKAEDGKSPKVKVPSGATVLGKALKFDADIQRLLARDVKAQGGEISADKRSGEKVPSETRGRIPMNSHALYGVLRTFRMPNRETFNALREFTNKQKVGHLREGQLDIPSADIDTYAEAHNLDAKAKSEMKKLAKGASQLSESTRFIWREAFTHNAARDWQSAFDAPEANKGKYPTVSRVLAENYKRPKGFSAKIKGLQIKSSEDVAAMMMAVRSPFQEMMKVVYVDKNKKVLDAHILTFGLVSQTMVSQYQLFNDVPDGTAGMYISHNHPSGNVEPSDVDITTNNALLKAAKAVGIPILDHVVTNGTKYYSLRDNAEYGIPTERQVDLAWEPFKERGSMILTPSSVHRVARFLRQDGDKSVVFYLDTARRIMAARLLPTAVFEDSVDDTERFRAVADPALKLQARSVIIYLPKNAPTSVADKCNVIAGKMADVALSLMDVVQASDYADGGFLSYKATALLSTKNDNEQPSFGELGDGTLWSRDAGMLREAAASIPFGEYERWNNNLDKYQDGKLRLDKPLVVLNRTPEILLKCIERAGGIEMATQKPIAMRVENLDKITNENIYSSLGKHSISVDELRNLQLELDNPVAVFVSQTRPDTSIVVFTELVDSENDSKAIVALQYAYHPDGNYMVMKPAKANIISSAYGKDNNKNLTGLQPLYVNTTKVGSSAGSNRLQLPLNRIPRKSPTEVAYLTEKDFSMSDKGMILKEGKLFKPEKLAGSLREGLDAHLQARREAMPKMGLEAARANVQAALHREEGESRKAWAKRKAKAAADLISEQLVDARKPVIDAINEITNGAKQDERTDIPLAMQLSYGRVVAKHLEIDEQFVNPALKILSDNGIDVEVLDTYLVARHAPERNKMIRERTEMSNLAGAGITDEVAFERIKEIKKRLTTEQFNALERAANLVWEMNRNNLDNLVDYGLLSEAQVETWKKLSPHYVPLRDDFETLGIDVPNANTMAGVLYNRAVGRFSETNTSQFAWSILQAKQGAMWAEQNYINNIALNFCRDNKSDEDYRVSVMPMMVRKVLSEQKGFREEDAVPLQANIPEQAEAINEFKRKGFTIVQDTKNADLYWVDSGEFDKVLRVKKTVDGLRTAMRHNVVVKVGGRRAYILFNPQKGSRGYKMGRAISRANMANPKNFFWQTYERLMRVKSMMTTTLSLTFAASNMVKDIINTSGLMLAEDQSKALGDMYKNYLPALKEVYGWKRKGKFSDNELGELCKEAIENGVLTGTWATATHNDTLLLSVLDPLVEMKNRKKFGKELGATLDTAYRTAKNFLNTVSEIPEVGIRLAVYAAMRKNGMSMNDATVYAREITVDFNKKGALSPVTNVVYMFSNAAIQGFARWYKALYKDGKFNTKGAVLSATTFFLIGFFNKMLIASLFGGDDDDEQDDTWKNIPDYAYQRGIPIMLGDHYINVPMQGGLPNTFVYLGSRIFDVVANNNTTVAEAFIDTAKGPLMDSGNFVNGSGSLWQYIAPTIADPVVQLMENKTHTGVPLHAQDYGNDATPHAYLGRKNTSKWAKTVAKTLNRISGGNDVEAGVFDVYPESVALIGQFFTSQLGTDIAGVGQLLSGDVGVKNVPVLRGFVKKVPDNTQRYFTSMKSFEEAYQHLKSYRMEDRSEDIVKLLKRKPFMERAYALDNISKRIRKVNTAKNKAAARGLDTADLDDSLERLRAMFLDVYYNEGKILK